ncbi:MULTISPECIES: hypothetical protein [Parabacteroides]|nr:MULTISPECIES: hypothetical protein [Parabacteroides]
MFKHFSIFIFALLLLLISCNKAQKDGVADFNTLSKQFLNL